MWVTEPDLVLSLFRNKDLRTDYATAHACAQLLPLISTFLFHVIISLIVARVSLFVLLLIPNAFVIIYRFF